MLPCTVRVSRPKRPTRALLLFPNFFFLGNRMIDDSLYRWRKRFLAIDGLRETKHKMINSFPLYLSLCRKVSYERTVVKFGTTLYCIWCWFTLSGFGSSCNLPLNSAASYQFSLLNRCYLIKAQNSWSRQSVEGKDKCELYIQSFPPPSPTPLVFDLPHLCWTHCCRPVIILYILLLYDSYAIINLLFPITLSVLSADRTVSFFSFRILAVDDRRSTVITTVLQYESFKTHSRKFSVSFIEESLGISITYIYYKSSLLFVLSSEKTRSQFTH